MKIIFLDIDGVLNTSCKREGDVFTDEGILNTELVAKLNRLISATNAKIVISSTWRKICTQEEIEKALQSVGFVGEIVGMTPNSSHGFRGLEIREWMRGRKDIDNYIIIDDDSDMLLWQANHFFNIDCEFGLTDKIVYKATRFLNGVVH
jgi:hypothetical protein